MATKLELHGKLIRVLRKRTRQAFDTLILLTQSVMTEIRSSVLGVKRRHRCFEETTPKSWRAPYLEKDTYSVVKFEIKVSKKILSIAVLLSFSILFL